MAADAGDLDDAIRHGCGTWAVPDVQVPAVCHFLHDVLPNEPYDPHFLGQDLETFYFDTAAFVLRAARLEGDQYLTLRLRCYEAAPGGPELYALSAKTEFEKWRQEVPADTAHAIQEKPGLLARFLPPNILARYQGLVGEEPLKTVVAIRCRRYAVENDRERWTLDVGVHTDTGKWLACSVLEHKSTSRDAAAPGALLQIGLRPLKLSKFLWSTSWR